jgi:hypothetical protein
MMVLRRYDGSLDLKGPRKSTGSRNTDRRANWAV